jgi:hypothetical protein
MKRKKDTIWCPFLLSERLQLWSAFLPYGKNLVRMRAEERVKLACKRQGAGIAAPASAFYSQLYSKGHQLE